MADRIVRNRDRGNNGHPTQFAEHDRSEDLIDLGEAVPTPAAIISELTFTGYTVEGLAERAGMTPENLRATVATTTYQELLADVARAEQLELARLAIMNENITADGLRGALRVSTGHAILVAEREPLPLHVQKDLLSEGYNVGRTLASNFDARFFALQFLSASDDHITRAAVAGNPNTTAIILTTLAGDAEYLVREQVAANPHTTEWALRKLAEDDSERVLAALASNPSAPVDVQRQLAKSQNARIELALARRYGLHHTVEATLSTNTRSDEVIALLNGRWS